MQYFILFKKSIKTIHVGDRIGYWPCQAVVTPATMLTGDITVIYPCDGLKLYDPHLMVGLDVVTYGSKIKYKKNHFTTCSVRVQFIPGEMKSGGILDKVSHLSNDFKNVDENARESFGKLSGGETNTVSERNVAKTSKYRWHR